MPPGGEGDRNAAAGEAGAANFPERWSVCGRRKRMLQRLGSATFCRAGFAGRGTPFAFSTVRYTLASDSDPRRSLGSTHEGMATRTVGRVASYCTR